MSSRTPSLNSLVAYLNKLLPPHVPGDSSQNGLQIEARDGNDAVTTIAVAVDAGEEIIDKAAAHKVDLLIVHHGLFWGPLPSLQGTLARKCKKLFSSGCSLYASHLPLDGHQELGNGVLLARHLGMTPSASFVDRNIPLGVLVESRELSFQEIVQRSHEHLPMGSFYSLAAGPLVPSRIAVITGSGTSLIHACHTQKVDTLITGEPKHSVYHEAKEYGINVLCVGHYASETFGVRKVGDQLALEFDIKVHFFDDNSGI